MMWTRPNKRFAMTALIVIVILAGAGGLFAKGNGARQSVPASTTGPQKRVLAAADVALARVVTLNRSIPVTGTLRPLQHTTLKSRIGAVVQAVEVREGDSVRQGQVLVRFVADTVQAQLRERRANLDVAIAQLADDEKTHESNDALLARGFISQNAYNKSQNVVAMSAARRRANEAQWQIARDAVNDAIIRAPMSGIVSQRKVEPGEKVAEGADLLSLVDLSRMELQVPVPADAIPQVAVGQEAQFHVDGFDAPFTGTVQRINPEAQPGTRSITVFLSVMNPQGHLRGGMFAKGSLILGERPATLAIPATAVRELAGKSYVLWLDRGRIARAEISTGLNDERSGLVEVKSGLTASAVVIASGADGLQPGAEVTVAGG